MTKRENEILYRLEEKVSALFDSHKEHRENTDTQFVNINLKIDQGQSEDKIMFEKLSHEIYNDENGLRVRTKSLEDTRKNVKNSLVWLAGSGSIIGMAIAKGKEFLIKLGEYFSS